MKKIATSHPSPRQRLGAKGEQIAAETLQKAGYTNIQADLRTPYGQIDLYAEDGDALVFIEVKTRRTKTYGVPAEALTPQKQRHLRNAALYYLDQQQATHRDWRIDVVSVTLGTDTPVIEILRSAVEG